MTKTKQKTTWTALAALAVMLGMTTGAAAADPDTGAFIIRIQPNVDLGVTVDTTDAAWEDGGNLDVTADLNTEKVLFTGVKLTVAGDFNRQEFGLSAVANDSWTLDTDETPYPNALRLYGLMGADQATGPAVSLFDGTVNLLTGSTVRGGQTPGNEGGDTGHVYEFGTGQAPQYQDIDNMLVGTVRRLWLRAGTPTQTNSDEQQTFTITVTALTGTGL